MNKLYSIIFNRPGRFKKNIILLILAIIFPFFYILSYCILLPAVENVFNDKCLSKYFYLFYEPIEKLRFHSDTIWKITEKGYKYFHGKSSPYGRIYSDGQRREIYFKSGVKVYERKYFIDNNGRNSAFTRWTENGNKFYEQYPVNKSDSKAIWYDANNKIIASGILKCEGFWNHQIYPIELSNEPTDDFIGEPFNGMFIVESAFNGHIILLAYALD